MSRKFFALFQSLIFLFLLGPVRPALLLGESENIGSYHLLTQVALPGDGGWDYLNFDSSSRRLYLAHADSIQILDGDSYKLLGSVEGVKRPHGVAFVTALGKGYASSGDPGSVVVFDLKSFKRLAEISTRKDCDGILFDAATQKIFTFDGDSGNATEIDPKTDKVLKVLELGGAPEAAVSDGSGFIYDNLEDKAQVIKIDVAEGKVVARWSVSPEGSPTGLAFDQEKKQLFVGCRSKVLLVLNTKNGKISQSLPIGDHVDTTYFDEDSGTVFDSCGDGSLSVIRRDDSGKFKVVENVSTTAGARTMAFDPKTGRIFTDTADTAPLDKPDPEHPMRRKVLPGTFRLLVLGK